MNPTALCIELMGFVHSCGIYWIQQVVNMVCSVQNCKLLLKLGHDHVG